MNEFDDFSDLLIQSFTGEKSNFAVKQIKYVHHFLNDGEVYENKPLYLSVELCKLEDKVVRKIEYSRYVDNSLKTEFEEEDFNDVFDQINSLDLRSLKNNYYDEEEIFNEYFELVYNNDFKIVGTKGLMPEEIFKIYNLLGVKNELLKRRK